MNLRRTKIIATLGPATDAPETLAALLRVVDCVRLNFSHGEVDDHAKRVKMVRAEAESKGKDVAVFADLQVLRYALERFWMGGCPRGGRFFFFRFRLRSTWRRCSSGLV